MERTAGSTTDLPFLAATRPRTESRGACDGGLLQAKGFAEVGPADPALSMVGENGHLDLVERDVTRRLFTGSTYEPERQSKPSGKLDEAL